MAELASTVFNEQARATPLAKSKLRSPLTWVVIMITTLGVITLAVAWWRKPIKLQGRILSLQTQQPIRDALVAVESTIPFSEQSFGSYVRTDEAGRFVAEVRGDKVSIRAWKSGYVMNGVDTQLENEASRTDFTIELRAVESTTPVVPRDGVFTLKMGDGFSLSEGRVVERASDADFIIKQGPSPLTLLIEASGNGGLIYQPETADLSFADSPKAPEFGYEKQVVLDFSPYNQESGFLFVRTSDGSHYAKVVIGVSTVSEYGKPDELYIKQGIRLTWAYQSNGSRDLELNVTPNKFFPAERFSPSANP